VSKLSYVNNNPSFHKSLGKSKTNYKFKVGDKVYIDTFLHENILCTVEEVGVCFNQYKIKTDNPKINIWGIVSESELKEVA